MILFAAGVSLILGFPSTSSYAIVTDQETIQIDLGEAIWRSLLDECQNRSEPTEPLKIKGITIPADQESPLVLALVAIIKKQDQEIQELRNEIQRLKKINIRPHHGHRSDTNIPIIVAMRRQSMIVPSPPKTGVRNLCPRH